MSGEERKPLRADAARNREKLLKEAALAFTERGSDAALDDIARAAGVGIGTLYRHFPTREDLVAAVYGQQVQSLQERSVDLVARFEPGEALHEWMRAFADFYAVKRGMLTLLRSMMASDADRFADARASMRASADRVLQPAIAAKAVRDDVDAQQLMSALGGICVANAGEGDLSRPLVDLIFDGLRYGASQPVG